MSKTFTNRNFDKTNLDWALIQSDLKTTLGTDVYESWIKKIVLFEEFNNYILLAVPTRFIRDWITSRYLDQILQTIKKHKKEIIRIEFKIIEDKNDTITNLNNQSKVSGVKNISYIKDSYLCLLYTSPSPRD